KPDGSIISYTNDPVTGQLKRIATSTETLDYAYSVQTGQLTSILRTDQATEQQIGVSFTYDGRLLLRTDWSEAFTAAHWTNYDSDLDDIINVQTVIGPYMNPPSPLGSNSFGYLTFKDQD